MLLLLIDLILHVSPSSIFFTSSYEMFSAWRAMLKDLRELHAKYYKRLLYYKGIPFTHVQTCDNVRVQTATEWDCPRPHFTHVQTCDNVRVQSATEGTAHVHTLHVSKPVVTLVFKVLRKELPSSILSHMFKPVITFVLKVLRKELPPSTLYTCPNL